MNIEILCRFVNDVLHAKVPAAFYRILSFTYTAKSRIVQYRFRFSPYMSVPFLIRTLCVPHLRCLHPPLKWIHENCPLNLLDNP